MASTFDEFMANHPEQKALFEKEYNEFLLLESAAESLPRFIQESEIPKGYYDEINPYANPEPSFIDLPALVAFAKENGKDVAELSYDEVKQFFVES